MSISHCLQCGVTSKKPGTKMAGGGGTHWCNGRFPDLASLRSVRAFTAKVSGEAKLDLLVNNAGVMSVPKRRVTEDGFELQFGTNFLGPFALTGLLMPVLLMPVLQRSSSPRVTTVSSGAANMGTKKINFDDLQWERSVRAVESVLPVEAGGPAVYAGIGEAVYRGGNRAAE